MSKERILILTDDNKDKTNLVKKLKSWDYMPTYSQIKAYDVLNNFEPDLILMDLSRSSSLESINDGVDVIKKFDAPLICISDDFNFKSTKFNHFPEYYSYIQKPFNDNELKLTLEMAVYREKIDKKLLEEEANFKLLYDHTPIPYHSLDKNGNILDVNESWLEKFGYERDEVVGKWFGNFIGSEYVETFKDIFSRLLDKGEILNINFEIIHKNGSRINIAIDCKAAYDIRGNFQQTHCIFTDISELKRAEKALKESEQYYKTIFENTGTATVIIEEDNTISLINTEFERLYGYYEEDIQGKKDWCQFVDDKDLPMMEQYHSARRISPESAPRNYEFDFIDSKGSLKNIYTTIAMIPGTKKSLVSLQDITERKIAETDLKNSLKDKDVLMREIHHRVKNNMQIISSFLSLQSSQVFDNRDANLFTNVQDRVKSMSLIHDNLYKSEDLSSIQFKEYVKTLISQLFSTHSELSNNIKLVTDIFDVTFNMETAMPLGLIISEMVTNSLKHAFPDFKGEISISLQPKGEETELIIKDNGVGVPKDFDIKKPGKLGLQLLNILVEQLEGTIKLDRNHGTEFKITFKELKYKERI